MEKKSLSYGIFLLILGFIIYEFGLFMTLHQISSLVAYITNIIPDTSTIELIGILLQFAGGTLIIAGFVSSISNIVSTNLENYRRNLADEILSRLEQKMTNIMTSLTTQNVGSLAPQETRSCRFCGAKLGNEDLFCPSCGKSQK